MTYELAKQLKEAGFPQTGEHFDYDRCPYLIYPNDIDDGVSQNGCYVPTLSELIDACGKSGCKEIMITNEVYECNGWEAWGNKERESRWYRMGERGADIEVNGATPEEAVAKLWLELNESKRNTTTRKD